MLVKHERTEVGNTEVTNFISVMTSWSPPASWALQRPEAHTCPHGSQWGGADKFEALHSGDKIQPDYVIQNFLLLHQGQAQRGLVTFHILLPEWVSAHTSVVTVVDAWPASPGGRAVGKHSDHLQRVSPYYSALTSCPREDPSPVAGGPDRF